MQLSNSFEKIIPKITDKNFKSCALNVFYHQAEHNPLYRSYLDRLGVVPGQVTELSSIPFLPIAFFKEHNIQTGEWKEQQVFMSSGTTGMVRSRHLVRDLDLYHSLTSKTFEHFYGALEEMIILALLPSYQEQGNSSLIAMVDHFMKRTKDDRSGYLSVKELPEAVQALHDLDKKIVLIGVSYALLDCPILPDLSDDRLVVLETGGMKGRKKEMVREELHRELKRRFATSVIHSEYGMTELLSQAYSRERGLFQCPPWMKVMIRDMNDPFSGVSPGHTGGINVIDLANYDTCAFIETKDIGRLTDDSRFEVLGRFDNSDLRGCNLLMA